MSTLPWEKVLPAEPIVLFPGMGCICDTLVTKCHTTVTFLSDLPKACTPLARDKTLVISKPGKNSRIAFGYEPV
jgi:hypothetical protein